MFPPKRFDNFPPCLSGECSVRTSSGSKNTSLLQTVRKWLHYRLRFFNHLSLLVLTQIIPHWPPRSTSCRRHYLQEKLETTKLGKTSSKSASPDREGPRCRFPSKPNPTTSANGTLRLDDKKPQSVNTNTVYETFFFLHVKLCECLNASRPSEHPLDRGKISRRLGRKIGCKDKTSSWYLIGFLDGILKKNQNTPRPSVIIGSTAY